MQRLYSALAQRLVFLGIIGALVAGAVEPVSADIPLPIVDIVPISSFTTTENSATQNGGPKNPAPTNGDLQINGTATLPLFLKGLSGSYDRVTLGALDSALAAVPIGGANIYPGGSRDLVQTYRLDYHSGHFNVEGGLAERYRTSPADSAEWHKGYVGLSYTTPSLFFLNHGVLVLDVNVQDSQHNPTPAQLAALPPGLSVRPGPIFATNQAITAVIPIDAKSGVRTATTFVWGAQDFFEGAPFPYYYDIFVFSGTKQVSENFGVTANITQVHQRLQGAPFPSPGGVETSALNVQADFHVNFADFLRKPAPAPAAPGRPTNPLVPGGPGGPAPLGPGQGGTVSPAPGAPAASPAPMMPGAASPEPMMSASPEPMMSASPAPMMSGAPASPSPAP